MLTSATAMLFGAPEYFLNSIATRSIAHGPGPGADPGWGWGAGPGHVPARSVPARSIPARSPLDPRSIPARSPLSSLGSLRHSLSLSVPVPVRVPVARSRSLGRSTLGSLALGGSGGRSGRRAVTRVARIACCRPPAMQRIRGITRQHARALCTCTRARDRGQDRASTPAASPSLDAGDDAPEGAEVRRRSHGEQGRTSARCWGSAWLARHARLRLLFSLRHSAHCSGSPASLLDGALLVAATCVRSTGNARRSRALAKFGPCAGRVRHCHSRTQAEAKVKTPLLSNVIAPDRFPGSARCQKFR
jgi:hypothetical protein